MTKINFLDKFPVNSMEIKKDQTECKTINDIVAKLQANIEEHPVAKFISIFDNYEHTSNLGGDIMEGITAAQIVIFCFGAGIPNHKILAVRPRSIGICEFEDKFVLDFMDAPKDDLTNIMTKWCKAI